MNDGTELLGSKVFIGTDYHGEIDAVQVLRSGGTIFRIVWWDGGKRMEEWVCRAEFTFRDFTKNPDFRPTHPDMSKERQ